MEKTKQLTEVIMRRKKKLAIIIDRHEIYPFRSQRMKEFIMDKLVDLPLQDLEQWAKDAMVDCKDCEADLRMGNYDAPSD